MKYNSFDSFAHARYRECIENALITCIDFRSLYINIELN